MWPEGSLMSEEARRIVIRATFNSEKIRRMTLEGLFNWMGLKTAIERI